MLYEAAQLKLATLVLGALRSGRLNEGAYRRARMAEVRAILARVTAAAAPLARQAVIDSFDTGARTVPPGDVAELPSALGGIQRRAVLALADALEQRLRDGAQTLGRRIDDVFRRQTLAQSAELLAREGPQKLAAQRLRQRLQEQGVSAFTDRSGRRWQLDTYSAMAVRTTSAEAHSEGVASAMTRRGFDLVDITKHPHPHDVCSGYEGRTFSLTGATPGYPVLDRLPPFHPNCVHLVKPSREGL